MKDYPNGWEISDFVVTARGYVAPEPDAPIDSWAGGPYPGWGMVAWTRGSSAYYWHDAELLRESLDYTTRRHNEWLEGLLSEDEDEVDKD